MIICVRFKVAVWHIELLPGAEIKVPVAETTGRIKGQKVNRSIYLLEG
jgi:hypothetical protein